ncbi:MAG TPA: hypothetical protein VF665_21460 [Longimicrobium sp.]|jgi:hypothetical protein|uniref:hypothetical protein n=1 Tax=Longimicrobium sp. TaxID=2029185 RepID=UPI002ED93A21
MRVKNLVIAAAAAALPLLAACDQPATLATPGAAPQQKFAVTSSIDPATGEAVANNYRPQGLVITRGGEGPSMLQEITPCTVEEPCDPPCDTSDPYGGCYVPPCSALISSFSSYRAGSQPYGSLEVSGTTSSNCGYRVLTGIGARINGSDDYTTLALRGRRVYADGTFGETADYRFGSSPNHTLEAWGEVPDGYAIVGVGVGQSGTEDVRTLKISYRKIELTVAGVRMTGPTYSMWVGANPYGALDLSYTSANDNEVFVGAGFRSVDAGEQTVTMAAYLGLLP